MANPEHVRILNNGVITWNKWREDNPEEIPDLQWLEHRRANLYKVDFRKANLFQAQLQGAKLNYANFQGADLSGLKLLGTKLFQVNFQDANLFGADLRYTNLKEANLLFATLENTNLSKARLLRANLFGTKLKQTNLEGTKFIDCNLKEAIIDKETMKYIPVEYIISAKETKKGYVKLGEKYEEKPSTYIDFPKEYNQAGSLILKEFSKIINEEFLNTEAKIRIIQKGLKISMIIKHSDGIEEIIGKSLDDMSS